MKRPPNDMHSPRSPGASSTGDRIRWVLVAMLALAAFVRLWGTQYGLPHIYHHDEIFEIKRALLLGAGQFQIERALKGGLYFILFLEYAVYFVVLKLTGLIQGQFDFLVRLFDNPTGFWAIGRVTVACIGVLNVYLVYLLATRACSRRAGLVAAAALVFARNHVWSSHFVTVDVLMVTLLTATLLYVFEIHRTGRGRAYVLAGLLASFATMTKFPAITILIAIAIVHAGRVIRDRRPALHLITDRRLLGGVAAFLIAMGVLNPGFFSAAWGMIREFAGVPRANSGVTDPYPMRASSAWLAYAGAMVDSLGLPLVILALVGAARVLWRRTAWDLALLAFALVTYILISLPTRDENIYARYALPVEMVLVVLAGEAADRILRGWRLSPKLLAPVLVALIAVPLYRTASDGVRFLYQDTRTVAKDWIEANIPAGSRIVIQGRGYGPSMSTVPLRNSPDNVEAVTSLLRNRDAKWSSDPSLAGKKDIYHRAAIEALAGKKTYDLMLISAETFPQQRLDHYLQAGAEYIVIEPEWYGKFLTGLNHERFPVVGDFYRDVTESHRLTLLKRFETERRYGPVVELYAVVPPAGS